MAQGHSHFRPMGDNGRCVSLRAIVPSAGHACGLPQWRIGCKSGCSDMPAENGVILRVDKTLWAISTALKMFSSAISSLSLIVIRQRKQLVIQPLKQLLHFRFQILIVIDFIALIDENHRQIFATICQ